MVHCFLVRTLLKFDLDEAPPPDEEAPKGEVTEGRVRKGGVNPESETPKPKWKPISMKGNANA